MNVEPKASVPVEAVQSQRPKYAGFWIRLVADLLDTTILTITSWILTIVILAAFFIVALQFGWRDGSWSIGGALESIDGLTLQILNLGLYFCLAFPYYVWGHFRWATTPGKRPFNIQVVRESDLGPISIGQSIGRFFGYLPAYLLFFTGFLMAAFHPRKQGLHEVITGTVSVIRRNSRGGSS